MEARQGFHTMSSYKRGPAEDFRALGTTLLAILIDITDKIKLAATLIDCTVSVNVSARLQASFQQV